MYNWPLNICNFSFWEKLKVARFILSGDRYTQGAEVAKMEELWKRIAGTKYAILTSSGSTANSLISHYLKDTYGLDRPNIVFSAVTWTTNISPFIREGFNPIFIDVSLKDFSINLNLLEKTLQKYDGTILAIFVTSLLGFSPDFWKLIQLANKYNVLLYHDGCESAQTERNGQNILSMATSTVSSYLGHHFNSIEGGCILTNSEQERDYFLMGRNHGMTRFAPDPTKYRNLDVNEKFDFYLLGNNYRLNDVLAVFGQIDLKKHEYYKSRRRLLYKLYHDNLDRKKFYLPDYHSENTPFCFPVLVKGDGIEDVRDLLNSTGVENRSFVSGLMLLQTPYKKYGNPSKFPIGNYLHNNALYFGLYPTLEEERVLNLVERLNEL